MDEQAALTITPPAVATVPGSIVKAICRVQASMLAVKKDGKNAHAGFMFASTDAIYAAISLKLAEAGLVVMCLEEHPPEIMRVEKDGKTQQWGRFTFQFVLATEDATWADPRSRRSLFIAITGPQSFQAANSYAEKSYLRSLLKISTGDLDLDGLAQADTEEDQAALNANGGKRKSSSAAKKDGTTETFNEIRAKIQSAEAVELLQQIPVLYSEEIKALPERWHVMIKEEYEDRMDTLRARDRPQAAE